jgi:hypothetical protein
MSQPTAPWWATLIAILLTAVVSIVGTIVFLRGGVSSPGAPPGVGGLVTDTITYIPHILLLFGVFADIFTMEGVYSIPSLVGIISIPLNYGFTFFWSGIAETFAHVVQLATMKPGETSPITLPSIAPQSKVSSLFQKGGAIVDYPGCYIQGFQALQSGYAPQTLVITATIFSYYMFDLIANRNILDATATIVMFGVTFLAEAFVIGTSCENEDSISVYYRAAMALAEGMFIGGLSYATVQARYPNSLPSSVINRQTHTGGGTYGPGGTNSGGSWVNGVWVPTTGTGGSSSDTPGTGQPAQPGSCPSGSALAH